MYGQDILVEGHRPGGGNFYRYMNSIDNKKVKLSIVKTRIELAFGLFAVCSKPKFNLNKNTNIQTKSK